MSGYGSYREPQLVEFDSIRLACITGPNGAGKSTILDGISFALLGMTRASDVDQLVAEGETQAEVSLVFEHDNENFRVTRGRTRNKATSARLEIETSEGWVQQGEKGPRAVNAEINQMLGISKETFASTVLLAQGESGRFATAESADRKRILSEILSLDRYHQLARDARDKGSAARSNHDVLQHRVDELDGRLTTAEADDEALLAVLQRRAELEESITASRARVEQAQRVAEDSAGADERLRAVQAQIVSRVEVGADVARRQAQVLKEAQAAERRAGQLLADNRAKVERAETAARAYQETGAELDALRSQLAAEEANESHAIELGMATKATIESTKRDGQRIAALRSEAEERRKLLDREEAECFTCAQSLDQELRSALLERNAAELADLSELLSSTQLRQKSAEAEREALLSDVRAIRTKLAAVRASIEGVTNRRAKAEEVARGRSDHESAVAVSEQELALAVTRKATAEAEQVGSAPDDVLGALRQDQERLAEAQNNHAANVTRFHEERSSLATAEREQAALLEEIGRLNERLRSYEGIREDRAQCVDRARAAARDADDFGQLSKAFGPNGIPNLVFSGVVAELERDASELMENLTNGQFRLEFRTESTTKEGEIREALDIVVVTPSGERPYKALSGGERFRVDLAIRVGLARLLTRRSGSKIDFLALDEGWGSLDPEGIAAMLDALRQLHDEFPLVLTITHTPEVAAAFEARFEVSRDSDGTSVINLVAA
jgi:exonuclease SbcC